MLTEQRDKTAVSKITLNINGQRVEVEEGKTVLEASRSVGIFIPTLCYYQGMEPYGGCRLCLVDIEKMRGPITACTTPAAEGMVVRTDTPEIQELRRSMLELILTEHPHECLTCHRRERCSPFDICLKNVAVSERCVTCSKNGHCELQEVADYIGISETGLPYHYKNLPVDETNPFFVRDYNLCILCERCVKACRDVQFVEAISYTYRGHNTKVAAPYDRSLIDSTCIFCGQCVASCPVGALVEKSARFQGSERKLKKVSTVCPYCGVGCNIELNVMDNRIIKVTSPIDSVVNKGRLCVKGRFGFDFVHNEERLTKPLIRVGEKGEGKFRDASWEEALDLVTNRLDEIKKQSGPDSLALLSSAKCTNEDNYLMQKLARAVIGTNNIDHCARL